MKKYLFSAMSVVVAGMIAMTTATAAPQQFTPAQTKEIQKIVKNTIINNPEILVQAGKTLQKRQMKKMLDKAQVAAVQQAGKLVHDPVSPIVGNKSGKVTVIEFYDYQCAVCHEQAPIMEKLVKANPNVRFIYRQLPIFGPASEYASNVAISAYKQGKFKQYSHKLFAANLLEGKLTKKDVDKIAAAAGVKVSSAHDSDHNKMVSEYFAQSMSLARALSFPGTPGIVIMPTSSNPDSSKVTVFLGYSSFDALNKAIQKAK